MALQKLKQPLSLIDTHCHLDFNDFDLDRNEVINRCISAGIKHIVVPAVSQATFKRTIDCCNNWPNLHLALGLHPIFISQHQPQHLIELDSQIKQNMPVAVGEIGLDFYQKDLDQDKQIAFFNKQLIIAKQNKLPVIIHNRKAHDICIQLLQEHQIDGGIIHAFNGSIQQAHKYHELGFKLGFGGMLTFERSNKLRKLAADLPLNCIVLETDAPDMTVAQHKGERNSPAYLNFVLDSLSELRDESIDEIALQTTMNALQALRVTL